MQLIGGSIVHTAAALAAAATNNSIVMCVLCQLLHKPHAASTLPRLNSSPPQPFFLCPHAVNVFFSSSCLDSFDVTQDQQEVQAGELF